MGSMLNCDRLLVHEQLLQTLGRSGIATLLYRQRAMSVSLLPFSWIICSSVDHPIFLLDFHACQYFFTTNLSL